MQTLWQDLRYALRMLLKRPGFTAIAIFTLALGIGANSAIFSVVNAVLLRPLPFAEPDRLVRVWNSTDKEDQFSATYPDFADWREQNQVFERMAAWTDTGLTLTGTGEALHLQGTVVTADLFPLLGVSPKLGRSFLPEEDRAGAHAVILSHGLWQQRFGADPNVIGQAITLNSQSFNVVGVMPADFVFPIQNEPVDLWMSAAFVAEGRGALTKQRGNHAFDVVGRLKPGVTLAQAQAEMHIITEGIAKQYPDTSKGFDVRLALLHQDLVRDVRPLLLILFGAVGCVLLIACANVANLLLARATARYKEMAIRAALGAGRWRVIRQLLTESVLLAACGGVVGLLFALWGTDLLVSLVPKGLPRVTETSLDGRVLGFTVLVALVTGILFGLAPALQASKSDLVEALKEGGKGAGEGARRHRIRNALIVVEVAVALTLLVGAGLLVNSFLRLQRVNPGFDPHNVLTFRIGLPANRYTFETQVAPFYQQLIARLETLPGVTSVSAISPLPLSGQGAGVGFSIEGMPLAPDQPFPYESDFRIVTPGYFRTMEMTLIKGRDFTMRDDLKSTPVVIINETLARRYFPDQDPIGKRINPSFALGGEPLMREIIGIVRDAKHASLRAEPEPETYVAHGQFPRYSMTLVVRASSDPNRLIAAARNEVQSLDNELPVFSVRTLDQYMTAAVAEPRFNSLLLGLFAALALILTAVGLYGVMSYSVTQRTHEIGIRMALGARPQDVMRLVVRQGMMMAGVGMAIGLAAAFALTRVISSLLYGVSATDPATFAIVVVLLAGVALLACYVPARRATKVDPMVALRYE